MRCNKLAGLAAATLALGLALPAHAIETVKVGDLRCEVSAGVGLIFGSSKNVECAFTSSGGAR